MNELHQIRQILQERTIESAISSGDIARIVVCSVSVVNRQIWRLMNIFNVEVRNTALWFDQDSFTILYWIET